MNSSRSASDTVKVEARRLRSELDARGLALGHSESLELLARTRGFRDWNTLSEYLKGSPTAPEGGESPSGTAGSTTRRQPPAAGPTVLSAQGMVKRLGSRRRSVTIGPVDLTFPAGCQRTAGLPCVRTGGFPVGGQVISLSGG